MLEKERGKYITRNDNKEGVSTLPELVEIDERVRERCERRKLMGR